MYKTKARTIETFKLKICSVETLLYIALRFSSLKIYRFNTKIYQK